MEAPIAIALDNLTVDSIAELDKLLSGYRIFQLTYWDDPGDFARHCIRWQDGDGLTDYQEQILDALVEHKRVCVRSPHGAGKTALAAVVVLWFVLTRDGVADWKIAMTASAWRQLTHFLLPEIHKWTRAVDWKKVGREPFTRDELLTLNLKLSTGEAFAVASSDPALIEGMHATSACYIYDEAKAIPNGIWDATEGAFAGAGKDTISEALALAISTPGEPRGRFYEIHARKPGLEDWWARHVTLQEAIAAGRISQEWADQRKKQWGEGSAVYQNRVLGEFATSQEDSVIPLAWVEAAINRWQDWAEQGFPGTFTGVGVDVGGGQEGGDQTVFALCYNGVRIRELRKYPRADPMTATMETAGHVAGILRRHGGQAVVDTVGIGAGVLHRLVEQGFPALAFVASKGTEYTDQSGELGFSNWRSAGWWILREMLEPESGLLVCLPDDDELIGDLTAPKVKRILSGGKIQIESKDEIKKRLGRSTDCGDAVMQVLVGPHLAREQMQQQEVVYRPVQIGPQW